MIEVLNSITSTSSSLHLRVPGGFYRCESGPISTRIAGGSTALTLDPGRQIALKIAHPPGSKPNEGRSISTTAHSGQGPGRMAEATAGLVQVVHDFTDLALPYEAALAAPAE